MTTAPPPLHSKSNEDDIQQCLQYIKRQYPNPRYNLFDQGTVMWRDGAHKRNWMVDENYQHTFGNCALFSDWVHAPMGTATIRIGLFMSHQETWVGKAQQTIDLHVWVAALRPTLTHASGKDLIIWDCEWANTMKEMGNSHPERPLNVTTALMGGQRELYKYLKDPKKGRVRIGSVWIGGEGQKRGGTECLSLSMAWVEEVLKYGLLDGEVGWWIGYTRLM